MDRTRRLVTLGVSTLALSAAVTFADPAPLTEPPGPRVRADAYPHSRPVYPRGSLVIVDPPRREPAQPPVSTGTWWALAFLAAAGSVAGTARQRRGTGRAGTPRTFRLS